MKNKLLKKVITLGCFLVFAFATQNVSAQGYHSYGQRNWSVDTAVTKSQCITYDNNANGYFAETGYYNGASTYYAIKISKLNPSGALVAHTFYSYSASGNGDRVVAMQVIDNYLYVLVNAQYDFTPFDTDVILNKYDLNLNLQWSRAYNGIGDPLDVPVALAAGPAGSILVEIASLGNMITLKYTAAGVLAASATFDTGVSYDDHPVSLHYFNNAIYVAGISQTASTGDKTVLVKYNNSLIKLWASSYHASNPTFNDVLYDMTVDTSGNIYAAGSYYNAGGHPLVIKYDQSTGVKLWTKRITSVSNGAAYRIFTDNTANPIAYLNGTVNYYERLNKSTGASTLHRAIFTDINTHFTVKDVKKGDDNNIYAMGEYDTTYAFNGSFSTDAGLAISKINLAGTRLWTTTRLQNGYYRPDFIIHSAVFAVKGNAKVYYSTDEDDISLIPFEYYCTENLISAASGLRVSEDTPEITTAAGVLLYPNPANNSLTLVIPSDKEQTATIALYDLTGKMVHQEEVSLTTSDANQITVETVSYPEGIYLVRINAGNQISTAKMVVKH